MNIDKKIFKSIFDKNFSGEQKDYWAMISAHYLLNEMGANSPDREYSYHLTEHGLFSLKCIGDIECKEFSENNLTQKSINAIKTIKQSYKLTQNSIQRDARDIIIDTASYHYIQKSIEDTKQQNLTRQLFEGCLPHSDFECGKTTWANIQAITATQNQTAEIFA